MAGGGLSGMVNNAGGVVKQAATAAGVGSAPTQSQGQGQMSTPGGGSNNTPAFAPQQQSYRQPMGYGPQMGFGGYGPQMGYGGGFGGGYGPQMGYSGYGPQMGFGKGFGRFQPLMMQPQEPQQPAWQQSDEWKGYQSQMSDLQNQLNQSPIMQQLQALQGKMQGYQQQQQPQPERIMPAVMPSPYLGSGYGGGFGGIAGLMPRAFMFKEGGKV